MKRYYPPGLWGQRLSLPGSDAFYFPSDSLPRDRGTYALVFELCQDTVVKVRKRRWALERGIYVYIGSAMGPGGIRARVRRHLRKNKKIHWHIDGITTTDAFKPLEIIVASNKNLESKWARELSARYAEVPGFGATDTKDRTHLFFLEDVPKDQH